MAPGLDADARAILGPAARFLASGAGSVAYTDGARVLRLAAPRAGESARLYAQAGIQQALAGAGVPTPQVLAVGTLASGRAYLLDTLVTGDGAGPSAGGWADLGRALAALHALPHSGFGRLDDRADGFRGVAQTPLEGLRSRLELTWPLDTSDLSGHELIAAAPEVHLPLLRQQDALQQIIHAPTALCHTDLHVGQCRWQGGRLAALMDFGDAAIGPPAWDVASVALFHGQDVARAVAQAAGVPCGRDVALFGLLLALHHARRARVLGRPDRLGRAVILAQRCLVHVAVKA